ncbi:MAG: aminotransferase class III [Planctomycetaceae bacterium]|nr:MAG: aminotransferase class III [Planctomycetaceae bacterium]
MATTDAKTGGRVARSMEMYERLLELIPGGTQLISRRPPVSRWGQPGRGHQGQGIPDLGCRRERVHRLGQRDRLGHPRLRRSGGRRSRQGADRQGNQFLDHTRTGTRTGRTAGRTDPVCRDGPLRPWWWRCVRGGRRIARGTTGRDRILFCGYHGWHDWYQAANHSSDGNLDEHLFPGIEPIGVPKDLAGTAIPFPYGDLDGLAERLERHRGEVAAVMMEPMRSDLPAEGYLEGVASLCRDHGAVLIFDEVSTGFRPSDAGVQPVLGVEPDMAVFAKSISNGFAMGAVVGRRDVMAAAEQMFVSSTYWGEAVGLAAAVTTLTELRKRNTAETLATNGAALKQRLNAVAEEVGVAIRCTGIDYHPHLEFPVEDPALNNKIGTLYVQEMAKRGNHGYTSFYLNESQGETEIGMVADAAKEVFTLIGETIEDGRIDERLEAQERQEFFRRLVS